MTHHAKHERLRTLIEELCLKFSDHFVLSNGAASSFYFDCKEATLDGECLALITDEVLAEIDKLPSAPTAIGGLTMGADFIVASVLLRAFQIGHPTRKGSIVRKQPKNHGTKSKIEKQLDPGTQIVVVDDVITTGGSIEEACEALISQGYKVIGIIALIDRKAGGKERLEKKYGYVRALFDIDDFPPLRIGSVENAKATVVS